MSVFHTILSNQLECLAMGKTIEIETTRDGYVKNSNAFQAAEKMRFTFWMDNNSGELCCKYTNFLGEKPDECDEKDSFTHKGQAALAFLYKYGYLLLATFTQKISEHSEPINDKTMALGLLYLIELMKTVDAETPRHSNSKHVTFFFSAVVNLLLNSQFMSFADFSKLHNKEQINLEAVFVELKTICNNSANILKNRFGDLGRMADEDEIFGEDWEIQYNSSPDENLKRCQ